MLFRGAKSADVRPVPLKPFLFKIREGYFLGLGMDPKVGSPCAKCVELWLVHRKVWVKNIPLSELRVRRELIAELLAENNAHTFYEIAEDGTFTKLDCMVLPHPECDCNKENYISPGPLTKKTNFAFSPVVQMKVARYGTPSGNVWLAHTLGESPLSKQMLSTFGSGRERETARFSAFHDWMKKAAFKDLMVRIQAGERLAPTALRTGEKVIELADARNTFETMGIGVDYESALLEAFYGLSKYRTLKKYSSLMKNPMLVVGSNNWVRGRVPFFMLQQFDIHLLFYPNSTLSWVVGVAAFSRLKSEAAPIFAFSAGADITAALDTCLLKVLESCHPAEWNGTIGIKAEIPENEDEKNKGKKLNMWWTHWIYRCPKISLKDVLQLERYPKDIEPWKNYFNDGQESILVTNSNHLLLPEKLRTIVKLNAIAPSSLQMPRNVQGIGTLSSFGSAAWEG
jgi:hypothetical protein